MNLYRPDRHGRRRPALTSGPWLAIVGTLAAVAVLLLLLYWTRGGDDAGPTGEPLMVYCAAGMKRPVEQIARAYEAEPFGAPVQLQYGGSGTLLSAIQVTPRGDLYLAADDSYIKQAREQDLVAESIPLAEIRPVIAVKKGNPKNVRSPEDLLRDDVLVALANPDQAAIGRTTRKLLEARGLWKRLAEATKVFKPTVADVANDIKLPGIDAGIVWDATANQYPELEIVPVEGFDKASQQVTVGVLTSTEQPTAALRFARYLGARDKGLLVFAREGFPPVDGDVWAEKPRLTLYSGGVNRVAIEDTVKRFEQREGVEVTTVYNGCGILTAQMRLIEKGEVADTFPDAYMACDVSFMNNVKDLFRGATDVSETDMVLLVAKGNPKGIHTPADLGKEGLAVGLADPQKSALGALTERLLKKMGVYESVTRNVKTYKPTADFLVTDMRAGGLDAVIVYRANTSKVGDDLEVLPIDDPAAAATQPYAVSQQSENRHTMERLLEALRSRASQERFESVGFRFKAGSS